LDFHGWSDVSCSGFGFNTGSWFGFWDSGFQDGWISGFFKGFRTSGSQDFWMKGFFGCLDFCAFFKDADL
jgi:hypothetical protein